MFCLDTNVIAFVLNGRRPELDLRFQAELTAGTTLIVPSVVLFELRYGIARSARKEASRAVLDRFLIDELKVVPFDSGDAAEAADIRAHLAAKGTPIGPYDVLIAAQARRRGAALVTHNRREFERVPGLVVTDWAN